MSNCEITRLGVIQRLKEKRLSQKEAGRMLGISVRQVKRLFRAYKAKGASGLVSHRQANFVRTQAEQQSAGSPGHPAGDRLDLRALSRLWSDPGARETD